MGGQLFRCLVNTKKIGREIRARSPFIIHRGFNPKHREKEGSKIDATLVMFCERQKRDDYAQTRRVKVSLENRFPKGK